MRKLLVTLVTALTASLLAAPALGAPAGGGGYEEDGVLTVGTNLPAPGFWNGDDPDSIDGGFEYGIAQELAERLNREDGVKVVNVSFDALVAGQAKGFDLAFSQVTITKDRKKVVDFSTSYFNSDQGILVRQGTEVPDAEAAKELQWGVQTATTAQTFLEDEVKPDKEPRSYQETTQAFAALQAGQVDAVLLDTTIAFTDFMERDLGAPYPPELVDVLGAHPDRVVLGSDFPNIPHPYAHQLASLVRLGLGDDWLRAVCHDNGARLLGL